LPIVLLQVACAAVVAEQSASPVDCRQVSRFFVVSHGWHTGLVLDGSDLVALLPELKSRVGGNAFVEIGWGDEAFYRAGTITAGLALRALFQPTPSVLLVVAFDVGPRQYFPRSKVLELTVPAAGYDEVLKFVVRTFQRSADGALLPLGPGLYGDSGFYAARGKFHAFNTCNTWVAEAIERTGFPMPEEQTLTASALFARLERGRSVLDGCFSMR
jgi:uncharacterized protein (TIGR02117 family)